MNETQPWNILEIGLPVWIKIGQWETLRKLSALEDIIICGGHLTLHHDAVSTGVLFLLTKYNQLTRAAGIGDSNFSRLIDMTTLITVSSYTNNIVLSALSLLALKTIYTGVHFARTIHDTPFTHKNDHETKPDTRGRHDSQHRSNIMRKVFYAHKQDLTGGTGINHGIISGLTVGGSASDGEAGRISDLDIFIRPVNKRFLGDASKASKVIATNARNIKTPFPINVSVRQ